MELFAIKVGLPTLLIGAASLAARRWGSAIGGWLVGLPLTSGPVILLLTLQYGDAFAARAAQGIVLGLISIAAFCVAYALLSRRAAWPVCWLGSWIAFAASTAALEHATLPLAASFLAALAALGVALHFLPQGPSGASEAPSPWWETPVRMLSAAALVLILTAVAGVLGPHLSGLITPFPVAGTVLAVFTHRLEGAAHAVRLLRGFVAGNFAFAAFFLVIATRLQAWGPLSAFAVAIAVACAVQGLALLVIKQKSMQSE